MATTKRIRLRFRSSGARPGLLLLRVLHGIVLWLDRGSNGGLDRVSIVSQGKAVGNRRDTPVFSPSWWEGVFVLGRPFGPPRPPQGIPAGTVEGGGGTSLGDLGAPIGPIGAVGQDSWWPMGPHTGPE